MRYNCNSAPSYLPPPPSFQAAELVADHVEEYNSHLSSVRDYLEEQLLVSASFGVKKLHEFLDHFPVMLISLPSAMQAQFADQVRFNGRFDGSPRIPNTCNISLLGPELQGEMNLGIAIHVVK